jgi:hypothetical protein
VKTIISILSGVLLFGSNQLFVATAAEKAESGLLGEYFSFDDSIEDFPTIAADKKPALKRVDKTIDVESTSEAWPRTELLDHFYIRWTGKLRVPANGNYTFFLESDDGSRLYLDGKQVVDNGGLHAMEEKSGEVQLNEGEHDVKIEFFENEGDAGCRFFWQPPGKDKEIVPSSVLSSLSKPAEPTADSSGKAGLMAEYYGLDGEVEDFPTIAADKKPTVKRVDPMINFESTQEAWPGTDLVDHFYIRWTGKLRVPKDGNYTFFLESDDGSRLFIDGKEIVDNGGLHAMEEKSGDVQLKAGDHELKVEFFENEVDAGCKFSWQLPGKEKEIVPAAALSH